MNKMVKYRHYKGDFRLFMDPVGPCYLSSVFQNVGLSVFILIALILISAFFAASETALSYCNRVRFKVKAENGSRSSKVIIKLLTKFDSSIIVILIGTNIFHICMSTFATLFACSFIYDQGVASLVATIATTLLVFFFSETIPKRIAKARPDGVAIFVCYPIYFFSILFYPLSILFMGIISLIKKMFHIKEDDNKMTEDDFQDIVEDVKEIGRASCRERV